MMGVPWWRGPATLAALVALAAPPGLRGSQEVPDTAAEDRGPPPSPSRTPLADSVERVVEEFVRERSCGTDGAVPCFPVTVEVQGRQYSVRETLEHLELDDRPVGGAPPLPAEMDQNSANPRPTAASVGLDPKSIVCKTRQLLRKIQGKSRRYYLYRVWDETGERAILRDTPLDPELRASSPHFHYVSLGEFGDDCQALKAYLRATHDVRARREAADSERAEEHALELRATPEPQ